MNVRITKNKIRTLAASALLLGGVLLTPAIGRSDSQLAPPEDRRVMPTAERVAVDAAAVAAFARSHHLTGLSPASLAPVSLGCAGCRLPPRRTAPPRSSSSRPATARDVEAAL